MTDDYTILLVDDNEMVRTSVRDWLLDDGFTVLCASGGCEALQHLAATHCDAAVIDLNLGDMTGEHFLKQALPEYPETQFMIYTGSISYGLSPELRRLGMCDDDVLYKPVRMDLLVTKIVNMIMRGACGNG